MPKFNTKKQVEVYNLPGKAYRVEIFMFRANLCDSSDAYIVVDGTITVDKTEGGYRNIDTYNRKLIFKSSASFTSCISKINKTLVDNAEDLDVVLENLIENSKKYCKTSASLCNYYREERNNPSYNDYYAEAKGNSKVFQCKTKITGSTPGDNKKC